jgi:hypothetical protein
MVDQQKIVIVANTHMLFNDNRGDIKLAQLDLVTQWLDKIKTKMINKFPECKIATFLCGDFNSVPCSGIYKYMEEGQYDWSALSRDFISGQRWIWNFIFRIQFKATEKGFFNKNKRMHPDPDAEVLKLTSWYSEITNTQVYTDNEEEQDVFFSFKLLQNLYKLNNIANAMERNLKMFNQKSIFD